MNRTQKTAPRCRSLRVTVSDGATRISQASDVKTMTFSIVISDDTTTLAMFPFAGTLEQAKSEAGRILSCFRVDALAVVMAWFEIEDSNN